MYGYSVYGLAIRSELALPLPLLSASGVKPDVDISWGHVQIEGPGASADPPYQLGPDEIRIRYAGVGSFLAEGGARIVVDPAPGAADVWLQHCLLGSLLALLMRQRGYLVLHASAVSKDGRAVAFLGDSGAGKSTTISALLRRGYQFVGDDILPLEIDATGGRVWAGPQQVKLWPDSLQHLGEVPEALPSIEPNTTKRLWTATGAASAASLPLGALVILETGSAPALQQLDAQDVFPNLLRHTYLGRSVHETGHGAMHFRQCARLVEQVSCYRLTRTRDFADAPGLLALVDRAVGSERQGTLVPA